MSNTITSQERAQRMSKALLRARAFVKMQGHDNTLCVTSGELFLFQDSLLSALEEQNKLHKMVQILSEWCAQLEGGHTLEEIGLALSNGMACPEPWQYADEAARRSVAAGGGAENSPHRVHKKPKMRHNSPLINILIRWSVKHDA